MTQRPRVCIQGTQNAISLSILFVNVNEKLLIPDGQRMLFSHTNPDLSPLHPSDPINRTLWPEVGRISKAVHQ